MPNRPRLAVLATTLFAALACGSGEEAPASGPASDAPTAEPSPDARKGKSRGRKGTRRGATPASDDCTVGMTGVLTGVPGFPPGEGGYEAADHDVAVRDGPKADDKLIAKLTTDGIVSARGKPLCSGSDCAFLFWTYEGHALPAYANASGFVEVGFGTGGAILWGEGKCTRRGWVGLDAPLEYRSLESFLDGQQVSFRDWDKLVSDTPGGEGRSVSTASVIDIDETREVDGVLWMHGTLYTSWGCEGDKKRVGEGWVPVFNSEGALQIRLYMTC